MYFRQDSVSYALLPTLPSALPLLCFCRDGNFLRLHPDCGPHTIFRWQVKLRWVVPGPSIMPVSPWAPSPWPIYPTSTPPKSLSSAFPHRNLIEPEQCTFCFTASRIDICLRKRQSQRWGGLEAPAARGLHTSSLHCPAHITRTFTPCHMLLTTSPLISPFLRCSGWCKGCRADRSNPSGFNPTGRCPAPSHRPGGSSSCGEGKTQGSI